MTINNSQTSSGLSRRRFISLSAAAAVSAPMLAACGGGSSTKDGGTSVIKYWDMPWGQANYNTTAKALVDSYVPADGKPKASYQVIQWNNFYQTFSSAIASNTGPAVSSGGGFQAFQFSDQGQIAYADNLIATLKKTGQFEDFLPGTIDAMKTDKGYAAIPSQLDMRILWYRKSLMEKAGAEIPTDWATFMTAGKALKKIGAFGFGIGAGAGQNLGNHAMVMMMINNGGGLFNEDGSPNAVNDRNIEAMEYVLELVSLGIVDPAAVSYSTDNLTSQWKSGKIGMGINTAGLPTSIGDTGDILCTSPLAGPHGDVASLVFQNNIMMYKNTPSQEGSEAFLVWYLDNMKKLWKEDVIPALPVLKSIVETPEFQKNTQNVKIIKEWQPVAKTFGTKSANLFGNLAAVDGGQAINGFTQTILGGKTKAKDALNSLQQGIQSVTG